MIRKDTMSIERWSNGRRSNPYSHRSRYEIVADILSGARGTLLDVGARDRTLRRHLASDWLDYQSADMSADHDFQVDLEAPLPFEDQAFDYVTVLDVLEHVEQIHTAFDELARVTRHRLIISLPNIAVLRTRLRFLLRGDLGGKYHLLERHQGDRHRWITTHANIAEFTDAAARRTGLVPVLEHQELMHAHRYLRGASLLAVKVGIARGRGLLSERSIIVFERPS